MSCFMRHRTGFATLVGILILSTFTSGQQKPAATAPTKARKITNAMSAAPAAISSKATIMDWPAKEGEKPVVLRQGSNGWTCFPDMLESKGNDPMCLDKAWMAWMDGYLAHKKPEITSAGVGYMIAPGGGWGSNTDPYAMKETPDNDWGFDPPHMMLLVPNLDALKGLPTDRKSGGPWVMFPGTPYAHIMAPVSSKTAPSTGSKP